MIDTIYNIILLFFIYSFLGWCTEVVYAALKSKKFVNRGFLNGTVCPIYGFGATFVVLLLTPVKEISIILLFLASVVLTSILEFITGFILEKFFHAKWWDYSNDKFNIKGYICLKFSILWGIACVFVVNDIQPLVQKFIIFLPKELGYILLGIFSAIFILDMIITIVQLMKFHKQFKLFTIIALDIREISDAIGEKLYEGATTAYEHTEEIKAKFDKSAKIAELRAKFEELQQKKSIKRKRFLKAFPNLERHQNSLTERIKTLLEGKR